MKVTVEECQQQVDLFISALKASAPVIVLQASQSLITLIKERSIRDGISVDGSFAEYSPTPRYKSSLKSKALNGAGRAYASSGGKGTYGDLRAAQGMKSDKVNLNFTGRTWAAVRPISQTQTGYTYSVLVGASNEDAIRIIEYNLKRYGNFLKATEQEENRISLDVRREVEDLAYKYLS